MNVCFLVYIYLFDINYNTVILINLFIRVHKGRHGKPKRRVLRCDSSVKRIYWDDVSTHNTNSNNGSESTNLDLPPEAKSILLAEAIEVRSGAQEDGDGVIGVATAQNVGNNNNSNENNIKYGTKILRRDKLSVEDMHRSFSIILPDRTFDIQCLTSTDFHFLFNNIKNYWKSMKK